MMAVRVASFLCSVHGMKLCHGCLARHCRSEDECWLLNLQSAHIQQEYANLSVLATDCTGTETHVAHTASETYQTHQESDSEIVSQKPVFCQLCESSVFARRRNVDSGSFDHPPDGEIVYDKQGEYGVTDECFLSTREHMTQSETQVKPESDYVLSKYCNGSVPQNDTDDNITEICDTGGRVGQTAQDGSKIKAENVRQYNLRSRTVVLTKRSLLANDIEVIHSDDTSANLVSLLKTPKTPGAEKRANGKRISRHVHFDGMADARMTSPCIDLTSLDESEEITPDPGSENPESQDTESRDFRPHDLESEMKELLLKVEAKAVELQSQIRTNRRLSDNTKTCIHKYVELMTSSIDLVNNLVRYENSTDLVNNLARHENSSDSKRPDTGFEPLVLVRKNLNCLLKLELSTADSMGELEGAAVSFVKQIDRATMPINVFWFLCGLILPFVSYMFLFM